MYKSHYFYCKNCGP